MSDIDKHIDDMVADFDKFRNTFNGIYLNKVSDHIEYMRSYIKDIKEQETNKRQLRLFEDEDI